MLLEIIYAFWDGLKSCPRKHCLRAEKEIRENLNEKEIDKMLEDSFPASDPPSTY